LFAQPPGRNLGNGTGRLGGSWGEIRGRNGVIIVAPSVHENADKAGRYQWERVGPLTVLPATVADLLDDATDATDAATDEQVQTFLDKHTDAARPELLDVWCRLYAAKVEAGESRPARMVSVLTGALKESACGYLDARTTADTLGALFLDVVAREPGPEGQQREARTGGTARSEWAGLLAWAVAQADTADLDTVRTPASQRQPTSPSRQLPPPPSGPSLSICSPHTTTCSSGPIRLRRS
jgi:hypothetical protein